MTAGDVPARGRARAPGEGSGHARAVSYDAFFGQVSARLLALVK